MATFNEQVLRIWDEWEESTGADANNPDDFVAWAIANKKLLPQPQDVRRMLRKQVTNVLSQAKRVDDNGLTYRAKQCVMIAEAGAQIPLWFDTDKGGTQNLRQKAVRQRRDGIADRVYRAICDVDHMNARFPDEPQLRFHLDFADDCAERRAADLIDRDDDDAGEAA
jgi:hypothetical protein